MVLITGSSGLLGFQLVSHLLNTTNEELCLLIRSEIQQKIFPTNSRIHYTLGDIQDVTSLTETFTKYPINQVYHCAGLISFSPFAKEKLEQTNIEGTKNIVNCCIDFDVEKLCYVSSVAAIGTPKKGNIATEETKWEFSPENSYYGYTKYNGELEVWRGIEEGLKAVIVNPSVILGPAAENKSSMKLFEYVQQGNKYYPSGGNNFVDVRDVVSIMTQLMSSDISGERFIIAGERISFKSLFEQIAKKLNVKPPHKKASKWLIELLWRLEYIKAYLFKTDPIITKETTKVGERKHSYSSKKVTQTLNITFTPIEQTIPWVVEKISTMKS